MRILIVFLFLSSFAIHAQENYVFYSNFNGENSTLADKFEDKSSLKVISLGDNLEKFGSILHHKKSSVLGDIDLNRNVQHGQILKKGIHINSVCPGPFVEEIDDRHVLISINSNWFLDNQYKFLAANIDCDIFNQIHMIEELEDILEEYDSWNKIIIAHHPITSISELAGKGLSHLNLIPIYGQLRTSYKSHSGNHQDMSHITYQKYIRLMEGVLERHDKIVFLSGHDRLNTVSKQKNHTYININTGAKSYRYKKNKHTSFVSKKSSVLIFNRVDGDFQFRIESQNSSFIIENPFHENEKEEDIKYEAKNAIKPATMASQKYIPTWSKNFWMGKGYREEWSTNLKAPLFSPSSLDDKLTPYAIGGGLQTMSIKFKSEKGLKYAFRVLDKQPEKSLSEVARESVYKGIVQELITTMHPYGPLMANELLNATDIIHIPPRLFILNEDKTLGQEYNSYIGKLGTLEEKPKGKKKGREGFYNAVKVVSTYEMLLKLRKSHNHKIDKVAYAKARVMDMYIGDWDRHEDNWKWARFDEGKLSIYKPIPKDRDHVFSHWTGLIPSIADMVIMNAEDFDYKFGNIRHLNFKARFLDRQLATELSLSDWLEASAYIKSKMTDDVIENSLLAMPNEVRDISGAEIVAKLKTRRDDLDRAITKYYQELAKQVQVAASNKKDEFNIRILENKNIEVSISHIKGSKKNPPYYKREFESNLIDKIYLFGLDGKDRFIINGDQESPIPIRIIGGTDVDSIHFSNNINKIKVKIYDQYAEDKIGGNTNLAIKNSKNIAYYDPYAFDYNLLSPKLTARRSSGNGIGIGAGFSYFKRGFNNIDFVDKYDLLGYYYPSLGAFRLDWKYTRNNAIGESDLFVSGRAATLYDKYPFYYGIGNNTTVDRATRRTENRIDYTYYDMNIGSEIHFYNRSSWTNSLDVEYHDVSQFEDITAIVPSTLGFGKSKFAGLSSKLNLDFTDKVAYPTAGSIFDIDVKARSSFDGKISGNIESRFSHFKTLNLGVNTTFIGSLHYKQAIGESSFYHLSRIGSQSHFRGYTRNRFIDKYAMLYNTECRINLGYIKTPLIRFYVGLFGFYDGGRVWNDSSEFYEGEWNNSYGGGFFISPGTTDFSLTFTLAWPEDNFTYSKIQLGFDF